MINGFTKAPVAFVLASQIMHSIQLYLRPRKLSESFYPKQPIPCRIPIDNLVLIDLPTAKSVQLKIEWDDIRIIAPVFNVLINKSSGRCQRRTFVPSSQMFIQSAPKFRIK